MNRPVCRVFFIKYDRYGSGVRFLIDEVPGRKPFTTQYSVNPAEGDEEFDNTVSSLAKLNQRLRELYPFVKERKELSGTYLFLRMFQELFGMVEQLKKKYPTERTRIKEKRKSSDIGFYP